MAIQDNLIRPDKVVNEGATAIVDITFKDEAGADAVPASASYTLYDKDTGQIINSRSGVSIPGSTANRQVQLDPADNAIVDESKGVEEHRMAVTYTYGPGGTKTGKFEVQVLVENLAKE